MCGGRRPNQEGLMMMTINMNIDSSAYPFFQCPGNCMTCPWAIITYSDNYPIIECHKPYPIGDGWWSIPINIPSTTIPMRYGKSIIKQHLIYCPKAKKDQDPNKCYECPYFMQDNTDSIECDYSE